MNKKSKIVLYSFFGLLIALMMEIIYLSTANSMSAHAHQKKLSFVSLSGLPDLALFSETSYARHRSLSDFFSLYSDDASLREYAPSTFIITHTNEPQ